MLADCAIVMDLLTAVMLRIAIICSEPHDCDCCTITGIVAEELSM